MYKLSIISLLMMLMLSGCFIITKPTIEQGNILTADKVRELHHGMSEKEVKNILGNPVLVNIFTPNRIEYVYTYQTGNRPRIEKRITLIFENGRLREYFPMGV